ncbi:MAG: hypothetical protein ACRDVP_01200 [Acidimicrobiales bacterium]
MRFYLDSQQTHRAFFRHRDGCLLEGHLGDWAFLEVKKEWFATRLKTDNTEKALPTCQRCHSPADLRISLEPAADGSAKRFGDFEVLPAATPRLVSWAELFFERNRLGTADRPDEQEVARSGNPPVFGV